jgi:hypothetical protein
MPISPESDYCLMGMFECGEITADVYATAFHAGFDVDGMVDRNENLQATVNNSFARWFSQASAMDRAYACFHGLLDSDHQFNEVVSYGTNLLANAVVRSMVQHRNERRRDHFFMMPADLEDFTITSVAAAAQRTNIERVLATPSVSGWLDRLQAMFSRCQDVLPTTDLAAFVEWERARRHGLNLRHERLIANLNGVGPDHVVWDDRTGKMKRLPKTDIKRARKAMVKGTNLFAKLFGKEKIKMFLGGGTVTIEGVNFDYRVRKGSVDITMHTLRPNVGHIPYSLEICSKDGIVLANGCVYFENTPVIDQLIALSLYVRDHEKEVELIKTTNWFNHSEEFFANRMLVELKTPPRHVPTPADGVLHLGTLAGDISITEVVSPASVFPHGEERALQDEVRNLVRRTVQEVLFDTSGLPHAACHFLMRPSLRYDEFHALPLVEIETRLLAPAQEILALSDFSFQH